MLGLDFRPFHLLLRWRNAHLAQPNSAFAALNQAKIIENRLASPKPDRLLMKLVHRFYQGGFMAFNVLFEPFVGIRAL